MNNKEILRIAKLQSAIDYGFDVKLLDEEVCSILASKTPSRKARNYLKNSPYLNFIYYGDGLVCVADEAIKEFIEDYVSAQEALYRVFDAPQISVLAKELDQRNMCIAHIADFYLPDINFKPELNNDIDIRVLVGDDISELYTDERFKMALCYSRDNIRRDEIAVIGYIDGNLCGVAGCSNDCDLMWQIGVDVVSDYRNKGVASTLTYHLSSYILSLGKVPFYCTAYSNLASRNTARKAGFKSAWVELTAKPKKVMSID